MHFLKISCKLSPPRSPLLVSILAYTVVTDVDDVGVPVAGRQADCNAGGPFQLAAVAVDHRVQGAVCVEHLQEKTQINKRILDSKKRIYFG